MAVGNELIGLDSAQPRLTWIMKETPKLREDIEKFVAGTLLVEPQALWTNFQDLKTKLYALKDMRRI